MKKGFVLIGTLCVVLLAIVSYSILYAGSSNPKMSGTAEAVGDVTGDHATPQCPFAEGKLNGSSCADRWKECRAHRSGDESGRTKCTGDRSRCGDRCTGEKSIDDATTSRPENGFELK